MIDDLYNLFDILIESFRLYPIWNLFLVSTGAHAVLLIASPLEAVFKWYRRSTSDGDIAIPYLFACVGSTLWLRYAIYIDDFKLVLLQTYAVVMQCFYVLAMLFYRSKKRKLIYAIALLLTILSFLFGYAQSLTSIDDGRILIGRVASTAQICGSFICPYLIYKAITRKVIDFIPFSPVVFTWIMELHAIIYSIGINDFYMLIANTTFFCFDGSLLLMFFIYPTKQQKTSELGCEFTVYPRKYRPMIQIL